MRKMRLSLKVPVLAFVIALIAGCSDQPAGYIFTPTQRDQLFLSTYAVSFITQLYNETDEATQILSSAALTDDPFSVLPEGWQRVVMAGDTTYLRNYNDEKFKSIQFDPQPLAGAIRTPSSMRCDIIDIASFRNPISDLFDGDTSVAVNMTLQYSDNRRDPDFVDGWYQVQRPIQVEYTVQVQTGTGSGTQTAYDYVMTTWQMRIEKFSVDPRDQRSTISFNGTYPLLDKAGVLQTPQVSGKFLIERDGTGAGEIWLYGQPTSKVTFVGKTFSFNGFLTLFEEDHKNTYPLNN